MKAEGKLAVVAMPEGDASMAGEREQWPLKSVAD
jgi:hypothetical protein